MALSNISKSFTLSYLVTLWSWARNQVNMFAEGQHTYYSCPISLKAKNRNVIGQLRISGGAGIYYVFHCGRSLFKFCCFNDILYILPTSVSAKRVRANFITTFSRQTISVANNKKIEYCRFPFPSNDFARFSSEIFSSNQCVSKLNTTFWREKSNTVYDCGKWREERKRRKKNMWSEMNRLWPLTSKKRRCIGGLPDVSFMWECQRRGKTGVAKGLIWAFLCVKRAHTPPRPIAVPTSAIAPRCGYSMNLHTTTTDSTLHTWLSVKTYAKNKIK